MTVGECRIDVLDRGFLFGDAVYEVVPVYGGQMFCWPAHFDRLRRSLSAVGIEAIYHLDEWEAILNTLIESAERSELSLYLQITRGVGHRNHMPEDKMTPTVFAMALPMQPLPDSVFEKGVSVVTGDDLRWARCDIKTTSLIANVMTKMRAVNAGEYDTILLRDGQVTESSSANVFIISSGVLITAPVSPRILPGITRGVLIDLARRHGVEVQEREIVLAELGKADEIWLTSSTREVVPVTQIDGQPVGCGVPGPVWSIFRRYLREFAESREG